ncbi:MAG TPA: hypothetical protein VN787_07870 [Steroidobacteraceae bacterium]|nr:hypothetical protein [Steroidobacteraceae bacterium]
MSIRDKITALRTPLLGSRRDPDEQERLLKLFWNRAELKKELARLDAQLHQQRDRLKQQEGATARMAEEHESLEVLLGNPLLGFGALVHFQLRALYKACHVLLEQFGAELRRQQEDKERKRQVVEFHQDRQARVQLAAERLEEAQAALELEEQSLAAMSGELSGLTSFWHYLRRRKLTAQVGAQTAQRDRAQQYLADMQKTKVTVEKEPWPEFLGVGLEGRRAINIAVLAYAQLLYARLAESGLALQSRTARLKSVHEADYGSREECSRRMADIAAALAGVRAQKDLAAEIRTRSELLKHAVSYNDPDDAIPQPGSLPSAFLRRDGGVPIREPNVLADDYWDVGKVLLG